MSVNLGILSPPLKDPNPPLKDSNPPTRIYFVGAHSTGKTTIARQVAQRLELPFITECARSVLSEWELTLDALRTDVDLVERYQREVAKRQLEMEQRHMGGFVSDRAFDHVVYAANHSMAAKDITHDRDFQTYMRCLRADTVFFVRPHRDMLKEDGVRAGVDWDEINRIDGMVKFVLEMWDINYITMSCPNMQERLRLVAGVLRQHL